MRDLELIQDAVLDSLALLGDEEAQFDPLSMHDLIYNFNQDISNVGASTNPLSQWEEDDNYYEEKAFEEDFYWYQNEVARSNNIVIGKKQKKNKKTKKNGQKVSPKDEAQEDLAGTTF